MVTIIKFPHPPTPRSRQDKSDGARIILFPGIRYERLADVPAQKPRIARRRKKA